MSLAGSLLVVGFVLSLADPELVQSCVTPLLAWGGATLALSLMRRTRTQLALAIEEMSPAFSEDNTVGQKINEALGRFPRPLFGFSFGLIATLLLVQIFPSIEFVAGRIFLYLLATTSGMAFGFGLMAVAWAFWLIWSFRNERITLPFAFRLRCLSGYACTLTFILIVPIVLLLWLYIREHIFWLLLAALLQGLLCLTAFLASEMAIWRMVARARFDALDNLAALEGPLWKRIEAGDTSAVEELERLETLRGSVVAMKRINLIPWDAFCVNILIPIVVGVTLIGCEVLMQFNEPPEEQQVSQEGGESRGGS